MRPLLLVAGLSLLGAATLTGQSEAAPEPGSGLGVFSLAANAPAVQVIENDPSLCFRTAAAENGCEGVVPQAVATLRSGPIGHGLAAVAWPGSLAAGVGSLLITVGGSNVPQQATMLNEPVRADAYTNVGQPTVSNDSVPGSTMTATALTDKVSALATVGQTTAAAVVGVGSASSSALVALTGSASARAISHSEVKDVTVAGVVHLASVVSDASASTNGVRSSATGRTQATGISVGGIPVTVDDRGVTALGTTASPAAEQATINGVLNNAGISMAFGAPTGRPQAGSVSYQAQSLVVVFTNPTGFTTTVVLGGANVSVAAAPAFVAPVVPGPVLPVVDPARPTVPGEAVPNNPPVLQAIEPPAVQLPEVPVDATPLSTSVSLPEPSGLPTSTLLLVLGAAGLLAAGLRRLPDEVLTRRATGCLTQETP